MSKKDASECCDMRGMLSFLVLHLLNSKRMHGTDIATEIGRRKGVRPSPGTIYPALKHLRNHGLIKEVQEGRYLVYHITDEGKQVLKDTRKLFCRTFEGVL